MIGGLFGQLAGTFKGYFSRAFWFAAFMPIAMATALHLVIASLAFPGVIPLREWLQAGTTSLTIFPLIAAGVIVVAYAVGPLTPVARGLLDASRLPPSIQEALRRNRLRQAYVTRQDIRAANLVLAAYQGLRTLGVQRMIAARASGVGAGHLGDAVAEQWAVTEAQAIAAEVARGGLPAPERTSDTIGRMAGALAAVAAPPPTGGVNLPKLGRAARAEAAVRTAALQAAYALTGRVPSPASAVPQFSPMGSPSTTPAARFKALTDAQAALAVALIRAEGEAEHRLALVRQRAGPLAATTPPEPTRMGDARQAAESYSRDLYGVSFDYLWPRLWLVMTESDGFGSTVANAQAQVDFAVMSTCMLAIVTAVWCPILFLSGSSPWLFLGVTGGGVLLCGLFYELAVVSQWALASVVSAAIDRNRMDLLKVLHMQQPATRLAERRLWAALEADGAAPGTSDLTYRYAP